MSEATYETVGRTEAGTDPSARDPVENASGPPHMGSDDDIKTYLNDNDADLQALVEGQYSISPLIRGLLDRHHLGDR